MTRIRILLAGGLTAALLVVGGPWVYINLVRDDAPDRLSLSSTTVDTGSVGDTTVVPGEWVTTTDSVVGYRVAEILFGQSTEGVGRTSKVEGLLTVSAAGLDSAEFVVDMATVVSDDERRDRQFRSAIMDTDSHPQATFVLTSSVPLTEASLAGGMLDTVATGDLTLRGTTRTVQVALHARLNGDLIEVVGSITVVFDEWGIPSPSRPGISVEDRGELEFRLVFSRKG